MKPIIINIKNLLPYIILIIIYFFFVNIEAQNDQRKSILDKKIIKTIVDNKEDKSKLINTKKRISIPVIPFNQ